MSIENHFVTVAPSGVDLSKELLQLITATDASDKDLIDTLAEMKVSPPSAVFLIPTARAVFLLNNADVFGLTFRILRPLDDDFEIYSAAWIGLEKFNPFVTEAELIELLRPEEAEEEPSKSTPRFQKQYARTARDGRATPLKRPSYATEEEEDDLGESDE